MSRPYGCVEEFLKGDDPTARKEALKSLKPVPFSGKILISGCGAICQCCIELLPHFLTFSWANVTFIDRADLKHKIAMPLENGSKFFIEVLVPGNEASVFSKYLSKGDLLVDLTVDTESLDFVQWCRDNDVLYVNASVENWDLPEDPDAITEVWEGMYDSKLAFLDRLDSWKDNNGSTAVVGSGANPGLVNQFLKQGLEDLANAILAQSTDEARNAIIRSSLAEEKWGVLAMTLGVKTIHVTEQDTQISNVPKRQNEFVNTWSCIGMYYESRLPGEVTWGTHEKTLPPGSVTFPRGPQHQIALPKIGLDAKVRTWGPGGPTVGMIIPHEENFDIGIELSVFDDKGNVIYRPTCHYAYAPSDSAIASVEEMRRMSFKMQDSLRILGTEITEGRDILGVLIMGHDLEAWWIGSLLDIHEARTFAPLQNATTLQVAIGVVTALAWVVQNPSKGVTPSIKLPHRSTLALAKPFLGPWASRAVNWNPVQTALQEAKLVFGPFGASKQKVPSHEDRWQFSSFYY